MQFVHRLGFGRALSALNQPSARMLGFGRALSALNLPSTLALTGDILGPVSLFGQKSNFSSSSLGPSISTKEIGLLARIEKLRLMMSNLMYFAEPIIFVKFNLQSEFVMLDLPIPAYAPYMMYYSAPFVLRKALDVGGYGRMKKIVPFFLLILEVYSLFGLMFILWAYIRVVGGLFDLI